MWIGEVEFPAALVSAHRRGRLVLFVGAGASMAAPSGLPTFMTLTSGIAADVGVEVSSADLNRLDVLLGRIDDGPVDVHQIVASRIGVEGSQPNRLHRAIVGLAVGGESMRLVTTNYDLHLSAVLEGREVEFDEYIGPALPMGDDFDGLVYLHGSLRQPDHRHLVVTDSDFGRAYLRDAWAARFLERMFASYTVLFVGYSHRDIVMEYLARALTPRTDRYILTTEPDAPDWSRLGIRPIGYQLVDDAPDAHVRLVEAVEGWTAQSSMGLLDHQQRIAQLVTSAPSRIPEEESYLEAVLTDAAQATLFTMYARGEEWLLWAAAQPEFRRLFDPSSEPTESSWTLARWFADQFVTVEQLTNIALAVVRDRDGRFGRVVWSAVAQALHSRREPRGPWLAPWVVLLINNMPTGIRPDLLEYALVASHWPQHRSEVLLLFDHLTEPQTVPRRSLGPSGVQFEIELRGSAYWLRRAWQTVLAPNLRDAAVAVLAIADRHLRRASQLMTATGAARLGWDPISFRRSAIEADTQDGHAEAIDVLVDATRDCVEALLLTNGDVVSAYINGWAASDVPLLRRLALHAWVQRSDMDGSAKLTWLRERGWLFDPQLRHEVFRLIEDGLLTASPEVAEALVADIVAGPPEASTDEEARAFQRFNALVWVTRHAPNLTPARTALDHLRAQYPQFEERERPDLRYTTEVGVVPHRPPMTTVELHDLLQADAAGAIAQLREYETVEFPFGGRPTWADALRVLRETVRDNPADGFAALDAAGNHADTVNAVVYGWAEATVDSECAERVMQKLIAADLSPLADSVSRLLSDTSETNPTAWHLAPSAKTLAGELWAVLEQEAARPDVDDWLQRAINRPAGRLVLFWVQTISAEWRAAGDSWSELPPDIQDQLDIILSGRDSRSAMAQVVLASQVLFFFSADRRWCEEHILPLLAWDDHERALRCWDGFLVWGRWNDRLLDAGLLSYYQVAAQHIAELRREELQQQLCSHFADIAVHSGRDRIALLRAFTMAVDIEHRVEWMNQVTWRIGQLPPEAVEDLWQRWIQPYWQGRLGSIPRQMTVEEASAMAAWTPYLTRSLDAGIEFATSHQAGLSAHGDLLHDLTDERIRRAPAQFAKLIAHLLTHTTQPFWGGFDLATIVRALRDDADPATMSVIRQEGIRLNIGDIDDT